MKKLLGILVLGLLCCNVGISGENKFTVHDLNINLPDEYELQNIGARKGQMHGVPYSFDFLQLFDIDDNYGVNFCTHYFYKIG